ncbi:MAG: M48 family metalloprotease [Ilumatobacter sp.]
MEPPSTARSRRIERSAVAALFPVAALVPFWLLAMAAIWLPISMVADVPYWILPVGWLAAGALLIVPSVQAAVLGPMFGARRPEPEELAIITPIWRDLAVAANLPQYRYQIRVVDADELNAFACGGHLLIVTSFALDELSSRELSGVLAHELSHHLGLHTAALMIGHWLSLPVLMLARVGFYLQNVARAATDSFASHSAALTAIGRVISLALNGVAWVFLLALETSDALSNLVAHGSEFEADRRAVRMGYGRPLADSLRTVIRLGGGDRAIGWRARLQSSHPPARTRVARIEAMLRHPSR